jgi:hypothetical protein
MRPRIFRTVAKKNKRTQAAGWKPNWNMRLEISWAETHKLSPRTYDPEILYTFRKIFFLTNYNPLLIQ